MLRGDFQKFVKAGGLIALGLCAVIGLYLAGYSVGIASGRYGAEADGFSAQYADDTRRSVDHCRQTERSMSEADKCVDTVLAASRENQRGEKDLQTQREMSQWAYWLLLITVGQSVVGFVGLIAVLSTLAQGREAIELSRLSSEMDHRPWLAIKDLVFTRIEIKPDRVEFQWRCSFENTGNSPARNVIPHMRLRAMIEDDDQLVSVPPELSWEDQAKGMFAKLNGKIGEAIFPGKAPTANYGTAASWDELLQQDAHLEKALIGVEFGVFYTYGTDRVGMTWLYQDAWDARRDTIYLTKGELIIPEACITPGLMARSRAI